MARGSFVGYNVRSLCSWLLHEPNCLDVDVIARFRVVERVVFRTYTRTYDRAPAGQRYAHALSLRAFEVMTQYMHIACKLTCKVRVTVERASISDTSITVYRAARSKLLARGAWRGR